MNVLFDYQIFDLQRYGGISRYFFELMNHFLNDEDITFGFPIYFSHNHYLQKAEFSGHKTFFPNSSFLFRKNIIKSLKSKNLVKVRESLIRQDFDIFHPTYYDTYFLENLSSKPFVITIHDMTPEVYPDILSPTDLIIENKKKLVEKAAKVIAISENTKKDILKFYNIDEDAISVIYHGCSFNRDFVEHVQINNMKIPERYILYVANRKKYKNFHRFVSAVATVLREDESLFLICAGGGDFNKKEQAMFRELKIENKIKHYPVDDYQLAYLYKNSLAFIFPSLYEGFGFPVLESFACGCPVILSNASCFPEIAGQAAVYFDPLQEESIESAVRQVIYNEELRMKLRGLGFEQMKKFSWEKTADETKSLYLSLR